MPLPWPLTAHRCLQVAELQRQGKAVNYTYAHSYLIHAYRGKSQDVQEEQWTKRQFRRRNPDMWTKEDGLTPDDLEG